MISTRAVGGDAGDAARAPAPARAADVVRLRPREVMRFDHARLVAVCDLHGTGAERYIASVLGAVEDGVAEAGTLAHDPRALARACDGIADAAREIGMVTMEQAARALRACLRDPSAATAAGEAARDACLHRLLRLGRPSGTGGWAMAGSGGPDTAA